jgi:hypothetical protein
MADEMLFWPGATVELSEDPQTASDELLALLAQNEALVAQRRSNIFHSVSSHDWRYRIEVLCRLFDLPVPEKLNHDIAQLRVLAETFKS